MTIIGGIVLRLKGMIFVDTGKTRFELRVSASALSLMGSSRSREVLGSTMSTILAMVSDVLIGDLVNAIVAFILALFGLGG